MKTHQFTITVDELAKAAGKDPKRDTLSGLCDIVEDFAACLGEDGLMDSGWYNEGEYDAKKYAFDNFDFDRELAKLDHGAFLKVQHALSHRVSQRLQTVCYKPTEKGITLAATIALDYPAVWKEIVAEVKAMDMEDACELLPELAKEVEDTLSMYETNARFEYVNGDRSDPGLAYRLAKHYSLSDVTVHNHEYVTITIEGDKYEEWLDSLEQEGKRRDIRLAKRDLIASMVYDAKTWAEKKKAEAEKRREERARVKAYQEEQARIAKERHEKERTEFLLSLKA